MPKPPDLEPTRLDRHAGQLAWADADPRPPYPAPRPLWLVRAFPTWKARSAVAHIKPVGSRLVQATA